MINLAQKWAKFRDFQQIYPQIASNIRNLGHLGLNFMYVVREIIFEN